MIPMLPETPALQPLSVPPAVAPTMLPGALDFAGLLDAAVPPPAENAAAQVDAPAGPTLPEDLAPPLPEAALPLLAPRLTGRPAPVAPMPTGTALPLAGTLLPEPDAPVPLAPAAPLAALPANPLPDSEPLAPETERKAGTPPVRAPRPRIANAHEVAALEIPIASPAPTPEVLPRVPTQVSAPEEDPVLDNVPSQPVLAVVPTGPIPVAVPVQESVAQAIRPSPDPAVRLSKQVAAAAPSASAAGRVTAAAQPGVAEMLPPSPGAPVPPAAPPPAAAAKPLPARAGALPSEPQVLAVAPPEPAGEVVAGSDPASPAAPAAAAAAPAPSPHPHPAALTSAIAPDTPAPHRPEPRVEPHGAAGAPHQRAAVEQVGALREALREARPAMVLNHADFGAVSVRLEAGGGDTWRAVLASRDPGFVPAIQAALADRTVAAAAGAPDSGSFAGQQGIHQPSPGEHRSGSSPSGGQGSSQPYLGQSGSRDGQSAPDHRRPSTAAALAARAEAEDSGHARAGSHSGGLFA